MRRNAEKIKMILERPKIKKVTLIVNSGFGLARELVVSEKGEILIKR